MLLSNLQIDPDELPKIEDVEFKKLDGDYLWMRLTSWGLFFLFLAGAAILGIFLAALPVLWVSIIWLLLLFAVLFIEVKGFKIKGYALREHDISYKSGLIFYSMTSIPMNRIQHCEVNQGPLARLFDLASVKVYTAGGSSSDITIGGLRKEAAHRLRDHITHLSSEHE